MDELRVGLMGLGEGGQRLADALRSSSWCSLVAVSTRKSQRRDRFAEAYPGVVVYDDYRSMIVESALDALFVAVPPFLRPNYLTLAAERNLAVWMLTPAARRFSEALEFIERFQKADRPVVVSRAWGQDEALHPESLLHEAGKIFLARGRVMLNMGEDLDWRGDSRRAVGGVLLDRAYPLLDTIVQAMGLPTTVYAAMSGASRPGGRIPYDTEDTAGVVCQFSGGAIAVISACWTAGPANEYLHFYGTQRSIAISVDEVVVRDRSGEQELYRQSRPTNPYTIQVEQFVSVLRSSPRQVQATLRQHLPTLAVIEAAYLSARTGQPESPSNIYRMHQVEEPPRLLNVPGV